MAATTLAPAAAGKSSSSVAADECHAAVIISAIVLLTGYTAFPQFETNLPLAVRISISNQVQNYFSGVTVKGIPWLDRSIDWDKFSNWPNQISFEGKSMPLELNGSGSDYVYTITNRQQVGADFSASYRDLLAKQSWEGRLKPYCYWRAGKKTEAGIKVFMQKVFSLQFYPSGELCAYSFQSKAAKGIASVMRHEYYDRSGKRLGFYIEAEPGTPIRYNWKGVSVAEKRFDDEVDKLYASFHRKN